MTKEELLKELSEESYAVLKPSAIHGIGVFAAKSIPKGCQDIFSKNAVEWIKLSIPDVENLPSHSRNLVETYCRYDEEHYYVPLLRLLYTAIVFNPTETADNLKKHGGFIPGIRPGEKTAAHIDYVLSRITVIGAAYLTVICLLPEFLISAASLPFYFGGTSILIVVSVTMDTVAQVHGYLLAHQYEGLVKKAKLRGSKR